MSNQYTFTPLPDKIKLQYLYHTQGLTQSEIGDELNVSQKMVFGWFKKLGIKSRVAKKRNQEGSNNDSWKGDEAGYSALHYRVIKERGQPSFCEYCKTSEAKRYEWANLTGKFEDVNDYIRLCCSCHKRLDRGTKNKIDVRGIV